MVEIHIRQQQKIGVEMGDDPQDRSDLWIIACQNVAQQQTGPVACQFDIPSGDPQGIGVGAASQQQPEQDQTAAKPLSLASA